MIEADDVIIHFLRFRMGDENRVEGDALSAIFRKDLIIDHCSFRWGMDEVLTVRDNENPTVHWCIIFGSLHRSSHHKGPHGYGGILWRERGFFPLITSLRITLAAIRDSTAAAITVSHSASLLIFATM